MKSRAGSGQLYEKKDLLAAATRRLHPSFTDSSYLVLRSRRLIFSKWIGCSQGDRLRILDIGGRYQPYRPLFGDRIAKYVAIDLLPTELVDVVASGEGLPFRANTFDVVIATQVLEYLREPSRAVMQIHDVLKPGGVFLASVAACAPRFVDEERWRFTGTGLCSLLSAFASVEIVPELYSLGSFLRTMNLALDYFVRYDMLRSLHRRISCPLLNLAGLAVEKLKLTNNDQFTANYSVLARKLA